MIIDWDTVGRLALAVLGCLGALFGLFVLAMLNDLWLRYILTPEEYQRMIDSYDDDYWY